MIPKVSIIVPCYGVEKYLDRCMESLVHQTLKDIEIILVDDHSPDRVPELCDEWAKRDARIKVIHKEKNEGLGLARNTGLDVARGEYVAFVDSDDYVDVRMYETLYDRASRNKLDAIFSGFYFGTSPGTFNPVSECQQYKELNGEEVHQLCLDFIAAEPYAKTEYLYEMSVWHSLYERSILNEYGIRFVSERVYASEDLPFQIDYFEMASKVAFIPEPFYYYCWNKESLTKKITVEKFEKIKNLYRLLSEKSCERDANLYRVKRLFIGYVRAYVRTAATMDISFREKMNLITPAVDDEIWEEIKKSYHLSYIPAFSRPLSWALYSGSPIVVYIFAKAMEFLKKYVKN